MKACTIVASVMVVLAGASRAGAQDPPSHRLLVRGDVSGSVGWAHVNTSELSVHENWFSRGLSGDLAFGWYWTNHLRTEVYAGGTDEFTVHASGPLHIDGRTLITSSNYTFAARRLGISQQYQFGHNQWFHPYLGAGVEVVSEQRSRRDEAVYWFDPVTYRTHREREAVEHPERTDVEPYAFVSAGFKAYMHPRVFFLTDGRFTFASRPEQVLLRFGLGVDF
ncbi:MAG: hypothetical protein ACRD15_03825 [Vicinamibacterales bacterium]